MVSLWVPVEVMEIEEMETICMCRVKLSCLFAFFFFKVPPEGVNKLNIAY